MDCLHDVERHWAIAWNSNTMAHGNSVTSEHSSLRRYLCMSYAYLLTHGDEEKWSTESMSRALLEIDYLAADLVRLTRENGGAAHRPSAITKCYFHCHEDSAPCASKDAEIQKARLAGPFYPLADEIPFGLHYV
jgi:hypothetical protein